MKFIKLSLDFEFERECNKLKKKENENAHVISSKRELLGLIEQSLNTL